MMRRLHIPGHAVCVILALMCAGGSALARTEARTQGWRRIAKVTARETAQVETQGRPGRATYFVVAPGAAVQTEVTGPGRLRVLLRPEFPNTGAAAEAVHVNISISGASRDVAVFSMPSKTAHYAGRSSGAVPGEVVIAYLDLPRGKQSIQISARQRVGVKLYVLR